MQYVLGFVFSEDRESVLLIRKNRPVSLAGGLNGIGGKIEPGETPIDAMRREFEEECGLADISWMSVGKMLSAEDSIFIYKSFTDRIYDAYSVTDEKVSYQRTEDLNKKAMKLLNHVVPLIHFCLNDNVVNVTVTCDHL